MENIDEVGQEMENYYKLLITNYEEIHDKNSVIQLVEFVRMHNLSSFVVLDKSYYVYKNDKLLYKALIILAERNFHGKVHEKCSVICENNEIIIYSATLQKFLKISGMVNTPNVVSVELDYHGDVAEIIKCTLHIQQEVGKIVIRRVYLAPETGDVISCVYKRIGICEDVSGVTRYKRVMLLK